MIREDGDQVPKAAWEKVLYKKQPHPDNFIPDTFLQDLRKNVNLRYYTLSEAILSSGVLTQEISSVIIFLQVFNLLHSSNEPESYIICIHIALITILLYAILLVSSTTDVLTELKSGLIFIISGFVVSPILKTLTETISTDTIYIMVTLMMIIHLVFFDYGVKVAIVSPSFSLNSAIFAGVCLASRLPTTYHAFALLTFATDIFVLFTAFRRKLKTLMPSWLHYLMGTILTGISFTMLLYLAHPIFALMYFILLILINFLFPYGFYRWQSYKANIYGPWDEAIIDKDEENSTKAITKQKSI